MTDSASVDMSRQLRAWYDYPLRQASNIRSYADLARHLGIHSSVVRSWAVPPHKLRHRRVPAHRIYDLCQLMGIPEPVPGSTPDPAPDSVQKKRCAMPTCHEKVSPPRTQCLQHMREVARLDQKVAAARPPGGEPILNWDCVCLAAGHQIVKRWTARIARLWMVSGDMKCPQCSSAVLIEQAVLTDKVSVR